MQKRAERQAATVERAAAEGAAAERAAAKRAAAEGATAEAKRLVAEIAAQSDASSAAGGSWQVQCSGQTSFAICGDPDN